MPSTKYSVRNGDVEVDTKSSKQSAVNLADKLADENRGETFQVFTSAGTEVHSVTRKPQGSHAAPWTRTDSNPKVDDLVIPAGFTVAYTRSRIPAAVARANDKSGWVVVTPDETFEAKDTIEARQITNELGEKARIARDEAKQAAKVAKAQERADAKAAKEAEQAAEVDAA